LKELDDESLIDGGEFHGFLRRGRKKIVRKVEGPFDLDSTENRKF
jgi:hypothetical protein